MMRNVGAMKDAQPMKMIGAMKTVQTENV